MLQAEDQALYVHLLGQAWPCGLCTQFEKMCPSLEFTIKRFGDLEPLLKDLVICYMSRHGLATTIEEEFQRVK